MNREKKIDIQNVLKDVMTAIVTSDVMRYKKIRKKKIDIRGGSKSGRVETIFRIVISVLSEVRNIWIRNISLLIREEKSACTNFVKDVTRLNAIKYTLHIPYKKSIRRWIVFVSMKEGDWKVSNIKKEGVLNIIRPDVLYDNYYRIISHDQNLRGDCSTTFGNIGSL